MNSHCPYSNNKKCLKWDDYMLTRYELEEADELCQKNCNEIMQLQQHIDQLESLLIKHGIKLPEK